MKVKKVAGGKQNSLRLLLCMYHGLSKMCKIDSLQRTGLNVVLEGLVEIFSSAGKNDYNNFFSLTIERVSQFIIGFIVI